MSSDIHAGASLCREPATDDERHRARLACAAASRSTAELEYFLDMLGLDGDGERVAGKLTRPDPAPRIGSSGKGSGSWT